jgi:DNA-binding protein HU-beta
MARTSTKAPAIETKALAAASKSEGMRLLYDNGYSVSQVAKVFSVGYAFAYGVAKRAGKVDTAAARRAPKRTTPKVAPKLTPKAKTQAVVATVKKVASGGKPVQAQAAKSTAKARVTSLAAKATKPALVAKKPGRPSATRRTANRKAAATA